LPGSIAKHYTVSGYMIKKAFPILALSIFSCMLGAGIIIPLLPLYADSLGATGISLGLIFAGFSITRAIFMPVIGRLSDRHGRKPFLSIGLLLYSFSALGLIWADNVPQLALIRLLQGAITAMIIPIAQAYVGDLSPEGEEGKWMGYSNAAFFISFGFGPFIGGLFTDYFGMDYAFATMGGLNLLAFLIVALFLPESRQRKMASHPNPSLREMGTSSMVRGLFSFRLSFALARGTLSCFLPIFAAIYVGLRATFVGILLAAQHLVVSLLGVPGGHIADRFNRRALVILGALTNLAYFTLIPLTHNFWQLLGLCCLGGLGGAISMPAASALTVEEGRKFGMGSIMGIFNMAMSAGMAIGPLLGGVAVDLVGINSAFYFAAGMGVIGAILFIWFTK